VNVSRGCTPVAASRCSREITWLLWNICSLFRFRKSFFVFLVIEKTWQYFCTMTASYHSTISSGNFESTNSKADYCLHSKIRCHLFSSRFLFVHFLGPLSVAFKCDQWPPPGVAQPWVGGLKVDSPNPSSWSPPGVLLFFFLFYFINLPFNTTTRNDWRDKWRNYIKQIKTELFLVTVKCTMFTTRIANRIWIILYFPLMLKNTIREL